VDKRILNLPYTDSKDEEDQVEVEKEEVLEEYIPSPTPKEEHELQFAEASSSNKRKQRKSKKIKKLKEKIKQREVL
jgi:hypothetical protein